MLNLREYREPAPEFGGSVQVLEAGPEGARALVLIHGFGESAARDFEPLLPALSASFRILAFDLPGFGRSARSGLGHSPADYTRFIHGMIARRFTTPVAVLGHSMGGALAIAYAGEHPELVARLLILDVAGVLYYREYLREVIVGSRHEQGMLAGTLRGARDVLFGIGAFPTTLAKLEDLALEENPTLRSLFSPGSQSAMLFVQHDFGPALRRVQAPTWLGWGRHDTVAPERTADLVRYMLRPAHESIFERSEHVPMRTEPGEVVQSLVAFLEQSVPLPVHTLSTPSSARVGSCVKQTARVFEGDYDSITLSRCEGVRLRNVRARSLWIDRSSVELTNVELTGAELAAVFDHAKVRWTGGSIRAAVCIDMDASYVDLAGVSCSATNETLRVRTPGHFVASASVLERAGLWTPLHGEYQLFRTAEGELPELRPSDAEERAVSHGRTELRNDQWQNANLTGEDMHAKVLRGSNFEGAMYDATTVFPRGFDPRAHRMREHDAKRSQAAKGTP